MFADFHSLGISPVFKLQLPGAVSFNSLEEMPFIRVALWVSNRFNRPNVNCSSTVQIDSWPLLSRLVVLVHWDYKHHNLEKIPQPMALSTTSPSIVDFDIEILWVWLRPTTFFHAAAPWFRWTPSHIMTNPLTQYSDFAFLIALLHAFLSLLEVFQSSILPVLRALYDNHFWLYMDTLSTSSVIQWLEHSLTSCFIPPDSTHHKSLSGCCSWSAHLNNLPFQTSQMIDLLFVTQTADQSSTVWDSSGFCG